MEHIGSTMRMVPKKEWEVFFTALKNQQYGKINAKKSVEDLTEINQRCTIYQELETLLKQHAQSN